MIETFRQLINRLKNMPRKKVCVAAAAGDEAVLQTVREALAEGIAGAVLVGNEDHIWRMACKIDLNLNQVELIHQPDPQAAVHTAISTVAGGAADVLMEGVTNSTFFIKAVASPGGLGPCTLLSCLTACEVPGYDRLVYVTDTGINACPDFDHKSVILKNAVIFLHSLGIETPKVAILSANEKVTPKMPVTVDAQRLAEMFRTGVLTGALVEGPMALDVAVSREAARQKGIRDHVSTNADLLLVPGVEVGSLLVKGIIHFARGRAASVLLGARKPVVLAENNYTTPGMVYSIALACYSAANQ
ncbi:MAG: phosphate acyltransferase [Desulfocucumaceae bacterium]